MKQTTLALVQELKSAGMDHEWYPTTHEQIETVVNDIKHLKEHFEFGSRRFDSIKLLDVGCGDGRVLQAIESAFVEDDYFNIQSYAVEKAPLHTNTYREKGITLIGTEFNEINFISKHCDIAYTNPPFSSFSTWLTTLIMQLNFSVLYAVVPRRWEDDQAIQEAMQLRGIESAVVLAESDFLSADRAARAKVHLIRFSFRDLTPRNRVERDYKPSINCNDNDPFKLFLKNELGLTKSYSSTTEKFSEYTEKERVRREMATEGSSSYELTVSKGVLWALLDGYERDLQKTLNQYKLISKLNPQLLQELGVLYNAILEGVKAKLLGYRSVYWSLLFEQLEALSSRLTGKHREALLKTLSSTALDFTYCNAVYVINYAVEMANELIEESLIDVFKNLTSPEAILRHYKSNERVYSDQWRHNDDANKGVKYLLDYRFIHTNWGNFGNDRDKGLNDGARSFTRDLQVAFKLLGYSNVYSNEKFESIEAGGRLSIMGTEPSGKETELGQIKFYKNGNRHLKFNQKAMLRLNVTVSRLLGWVRSKEEFAQEAETAKPIDDAIWLVSEGMKVVPSNILMLTISKALAA